MQRRQHGAEPSVRAARSERRRTDRRPTDDTGPVEARVRKREVVEHRAPDDVDANVAEVVGVGRPGAEHTALQPELNVGFVLRSACRLATTAQPGGWSPRRESLRAAEAVAASLDRQ
jgi:hypothetical protein